MTVFLWLLISLLFAATLARVRYTRGVATEHIFYRWHDVAGVAMVGGAICTMALQIVL